MIFLVYAAGCRCGSPTGRTGTWLRPSPAIPPPRSNSSKHPVPLYGQGSSGHRTARYPTARARSHDNSTAKSPKNRMAPRPHKLELPFVKCKSVFMCKHPSSTVSGTTIACKVPKFAEELDRKAISAQRFSALSLLASPFFVMKRCSAYRYCCLRCGVEFSHVHGDAWFFSGSTCER